MRTHSPLSPSGFRPGDPPCRQELTGSHASRGSAWRRRPGFSQQMVSTRIARSSRPGSTSLEVVKLVEPTCDEGAGRVETRSWVSGCWDRVWFSGASSGFDSAVRWRSRAGSTNLEVVKLVEPTCDEGAGRVETMVRVSGILWWGLLVGCRLVSTRVARSSRPGSTSFGGGTRAPAQPVLGEGLATRLNRLRQDLRFFPAPGPSLPFLCVKRGWGTVQRCVVTLNRRVSAIHVREGCG